jgi:hypothetical protein
MVRPRARFLDRTPRERASVHRVHVVDPEHDSTPDGPSGRTDRVELKVEVAGADPEARKRRLGSSVEQMEPERLVEGPTASSMLTVSSVTALMLSTGGCCASTRPALQEFERQNAGETAPFARGQGDGSSWRGVPDHRVNGTPALGSTTRVPFSLTGRSRRHCVRRAWPKGCAAG